MIVRAGMPIPQEQLFILHKTIFMLIYFAAPLFSEAEPTGRDARTTITIIYTS